jgi:hypothetical protein
VNGVLRFPERPALHPGDPVRIARGLLRGLTGLHAGLRGHERVIVLLQILGHMTLPRDDVEAL